MSWGRVLGRRGGEGGVKGMTREKLGADKVRRISRGLYWPEIPGKRETRAHNFWLNLGWYFVPPNRQRGDSGMDVKLTGGKRV